MLCINMIYAPSTYRFRQFNINLYTVRQVFKDLLICYDECIHHFHLVYIRIFCLHHTYNWFDVLFYISTND